MHTSTHLVSPIVNVLAVVFADAGIPSVSPLQGGVCPEGSIARAFYRAFNELINDDNYGFWRIVGMAQVAGTDNYYVTLLYTASQDIIEEEQDAGLPEPKTLDALLAPPRGLLALFEQGSVGVAFVDNTVTIVGTPKGVLRATHPLRVYIQVKIPTVG